MYQGRCSAVFFLGIIENLGIWKIQAGWKDTISFAVLIVFLLLRPEGILGKRKLKKRLIVDGLKTIDDRLWTVDLRKR